MTIRKVLIISRYYFKLTQKNREVIPRKQFEVKTCIAYRDVEIAYFPISTYNNILTKKMTCNVPIKKALNLFFTSIYNSNNLYTIRLINDTTATYLLYKHIRT